jgi:putative phosphoesterase
MRIGVVSDTHGNLKTSRAAAAKLGGYDIDAVLHCGDIGSVEVIPLFDRWPTHFVFGNVDYNEEELREAIEVAGQTCHGRFGALELAGCPIALIHSDDGGLFRETIASGKYALVCYGHTHVADEQVHGSTLVLNPGALHRAKVHTFAVVELPKLKVEHVALERE